MAAYLIVRAHVVSDDDRDAFESWYHEEHLPDAHGRFEATHAWRGWSEVEHNVHYAFYGFEDVPTAMAISQSDAIKALVAEFDRTWGDRVTRTRDVVEMRHSIGPN
ncbi:MAG: hypothetical protein HOI95_02620 [Chromatiales bacterium]|jgi:hypothetical protein|nr:hypothetical protein [Chromatiales bacterium]